MAILRDNWIVIAITVAVIAALTLLIWLWWHVPKWQMQNRIFKSEKERADAEDNFRKTVGQALGGVAVLIGAGAAYLQFTQQQQASHNLLISNQASKGFEQLASDKITMRLGGLYALEGVMNTSSDYHQPVLEALCAFVRDGTIGMIVSIRPATDIQTALTVIGRRSEGRGEVNLFGADLEVANLLEAKLIDAKLDKANLVYANLTGARLSRASPFDAKLHGADLNDADLSGATLSAADLRVAHLRGTNLKGARLDGADLNDADLRGATLRDADLSFATLGQTIVTQAQLDQACGTHVTLPDGQVRDLKPCPVK
jgi:hypothetical protein